ncbi:SUV3, partial [Symbiodinium microadriaticum]
ADIFSIKREIERLTDHKCCVVYGELPPETRSGQARLFNDEGTGYDVLVASDAIGMGLNLNIRRIIFHTTVKPSYGTQRRQAARHMDITSIKQIAGRAGRLSSQYEYGEVTTWQEQDLAYLKSVIHEATPQIKAAGIFPSVDQVDLFSRHLLALAGTGPAHSHDQEEDEEGENVVCAGRLDDVVENVPLGHHKSGEAEMGAKEISSVQATMRLSAVVERFMESSRTTGQYFLCDHDPLIITANWLNSIPMSLPDRFVRYLSRIE